LVSTQRQESCSDSSNSRTVSPLPPPAKLSISGLAPRMFSTRAVLVTLPLAATETLRARFTSQGRNEAYSIVR